MVLYKPEYRDKLKELLVAMEERSILIKNQQTNGLELGVEEFKEKINKVQEEFKNIEKKYGENKNLMVTSNTYSRKYQEELDHSFQEGEKQTQELIDSLLVTL